MMDRLVRSQDRLYQSASSSEERRADTVSKDIDSFKGVERRNPVSISMPIEKRRPYLHSVRIESGKKKTEEQDPE